MILDTSRRGMVRCAMLLALTVLCAPAAPQQGFQDALPEDTLAFLGVDDASAYGRDWSTSSLGRFWESGAMSPMRERIAQDLGELRAKMQQEVGVDLLRLPGMIDGPVAVALVDLAMPAGDQLDEPSVAIAVLADVGRQREECESLIGALLRKVVAKEHEVVLERQQIGGLDVTALVSADSDDELIRLRSAFHGNTLILVLQFGDLARDPFLRVVEGLDGRGGGGLDAAPGFRTSLAGGQRPGLRLYADIGRILGTVFDGVEASGEMDMHEAATLRALGLRDTGVLSMNVQCGQAGSTAALRMDWPGDGWIQRILRHLWQPGDFPAARCVPAGVRSMVAFNADLPGMFDTVSRMLIEMRTITPAELVEALTQAEAELGFNPREELLELLTGEFIVVTDDVDASEALPFVAGETTNVALIVGLHDGEAFTTLIDGLVRKFGFHVGRKSEEFQGFTVYQVPVPVLPISLGYAVLDDMVVLSLSPTMLRDILRHKASPDLPSLIGSANYLEAVGRVQPGYGMIGYSDTASDMKQLLRTIRTLPDLIGEAGGSHNPLAWLQQWPLPDESAIDEYFSGGTVSVCTIDARGLSFESAGP